MLAASIRTSTSSGPGVGTGTSSRTRPGSASRLRIARIVSTAGRSCHGPVAGRWANASPGFGFPPMPSRPARRDDDRDGAGSLLRPGRPRSSSRSSCEPPAERRVAHRRGGLQHLPAPLRGRLRRPAHGQRHVGALAGAARGDGARRRGVRGIAQLLPARAGGARDLRLPLPRPRAPGPRRGAPARPRARPPGDDRPLEPLLHDVARARRARRRPLGRRRDRRGERARVAVPVQGEHRPRQARGRARRGRARRGRVRPPGGVPEHGRAASRSRSRTSSAVRELTRRLRGAASSSTRPASPRTRSSSRSASPSYARPLARRS